MALETCSSPKFLVTDIISQKSEVPANFVRPEHERPNRHAIEEAPIETIPIIDLNGLNHPQTVDAIGQACEIHGFFMVTNHGIPKELLNAMLRVGREFFHLPESERNHLCSEEPLKAVRLTSGFNAMAEHVRMWRDALKLRCHPIEEYIDQWPINPPDFREVAAEYSKQGRELGVRITELISESLGLENEFLEETMGGQLPLLAVNYYPPCPQPDLVLGFNPHTDANSITVILHDEISGLEVLRDGKWVRVPSVKNSFTVIIGDQIQVLSNEKYKSVIHRVTLTSKNERFSVSIFFRPSNKIPIKPADKLVNEKNPAVYRPYFYKEYISTVWSNGLNVPTLLNYFKV